MCRHFGGLKVGKGIPRYYNTYDEYYGIRHEGTRMTKKRKIYHGSQQIIQKPEFGKGRTYNDYGQGFYCTESVELAKEWACPSVHDGYANCYELCLDGLNILYLTRGEFNILNWLALLLANRHFDINSPMGAGAREAEHGQPNMKKVHPAS